jgi:tetratricopeptide (TPR) repeat protein
MTCGWGVLVIPLVCFPSLNDGFTEGKWLAVYILAVLAGINFLLNQKVELLRVKSWDLPLKLLGSASLFFYLTSCLVNFHAFNGLLVLRLLSALLIFLMSLEIFKSKDWSLNFLKLAVLSGFLALAAEDLSSILKIKDFFGHPNMSSEFYGFFFMAGLLLLPQSRSRKFQGFLILGLLNALVLIIEHKTRSVLLAVIFSSLILQFKGYFYSFKKKTKAITLVLLGLAFFLFLPSLGILKNKSLDVLKLGTDEQKHVSADLRLIRWKNSLALISEHPWGVGFQEYQFSYLNFNHSYALDNEVNERVVSFSPHNTFLDIASEYGIPVAICFTTLMGLLIFKVSQLQLSQSQYFESRIIFVLLGYVFVLALFAFPLENAWSFTLFIFCCAWLLATLQGSRSFQLKGLKFVALGLVVILSFSLTILFAGTKWVELKYSQQENYNRWACFLFPAHWKTCVNWSQNLMNQGRWIEAEEDLKQILVRQPDNFVAQKQLSLLYFRTNRIADSCEQVQKLDHYFGGNHSMTKFKAEHCQTPP